MSKNYCYKLQKRKALLDKFGGLPETIVENKEWLYMLEEETRHSLSIEGYFATEEELKAILGGGKSKPEILNYYRTAQTLYDLGLQYYRDKMFWLNLPLIRHIHSELFREVDFFSKFRGLLRQGTITIQGAKVKPPVLDLEEYIRVFCQISVHYLENNHILSALALIHTLFESIHPFEDGNGRVGRILLNYLAVSQGYPPIVIKGIQKEERERYYEALELADKGFHEGFPAPQIDSLEQRLKLGEFQLLEQILYEGLKPRLDQMVATTLELKQPLLGFKNLALHFGVKEGTLRQWVSRDKLIAIKRGNKLYSHPSLYLS
jgi:Fic family protein